MSKRKAGTGSGTGFKGPAQPDPTRLFLNDLRNTLPYDPTLSHRLCFRTDCLDAGRCAATMPVYGQGILHKRP